MNFRVTPALLPPAPAARNPRHRRRFKPRHDLAEEVMAGFLWMSLNLPADATLEEMKELAHQLAQRIRTGDSETLVEAQLDYLQRHHFCRPAKPESLRALARRAVTLVSARQAS